jgi:hypothetical protein
MFFPVSLSCQQIFDRYRSHRRLTCSDYLQDVISLHKVYNKSSLKNAKAGEVFASRVAELGSTASFVKELREGDETTHLPHSPRSSGDRSPRISEQSKFLVFYFFSCGFVILLLKQN